jgi:hypothetical protein
MGYIAEIMKIKLRDDEGVIQGCLKYNDPIMEE